MKWYNCQSDKLPDDQEEVLISANTIHYIAVFDAKKKIFVIPNEARDMSFKASDPNIYWTKYTRPGRKKSD
jgi:hypothetical protein